MQRRYLYLSAGLAVIAAAGLIADRTTQLRKYVLPDHIDYGRKNDPAQWLARHTRWTPHQTAGRPADEDDRHLRRQADRQHRRVARSRRQRDRYQSEKLEQTFDIGKNWAGMSLDPATGTVFLSSGGTPKKGYEETAAELKHKIAPEVMAMVGKPVLRLHYEKGRLNLQRPLPIDGVSPKSYFISGVTVQIAEFSTFSKSMPTRSSGCPARTSRHRSPPPPEPAPTPRNFHPMAKRWPSPIGAANR